MEREQSSNVENLKEKAEYQPSVDILENEKEFLLVADLPGATNEGIDVHFEKGVLTISAEVPERIQGSGVRALKREYGVGGFRRSFKIGEHVDVDGISARHSLGVLYLTLPKRAELQPKKIVVQHA